MGEPTIKIFSAAGQYEGCFLNPQIEFFPDSEYDFEGDFFDAGGKLVNKVEYNPEALPYTAELDGMEDIKHKRLCKVYVQHSRTPIKMSGKVE